MLKAELISRNAELEREIKQVRATYLGVLEAHELLLDHTTTIENILYDVPLSAIEKICGFDGADALIGILEQRALQVPYFRLQLEWIIDGVQEAMAEQENGEEQDVCDAG